MKILFFERIFKHNQVLSLYTPTAKWAQTTSCNQRLSSILETETNYPHRNMARKTALSPLNTDCNSDAHWCILD